MTAARRAGVLMPLDPLRDFLAHYSVGMAGKIAQHAIIESIRGNTIRLVLPSAHRHLMLGSVCDRLHMALQAHIGRPVRLIIEVR